MGIVFRQSVKTSIVIFSGAILGAAFLFLQQYFMPQQEMGFVRNMTNQAVIASQITLLGMNNMLNVFIHKYPVEDRRRHALIALSIVVPLLFTTALGVFYFLFRDQIVALYNPEDALFVRRFFILLPFYTILWCYTTLLEQYLMTQMKVALSTFMREIILRVLNIVVILLFAANAIDFSDLVWLTVGVHVAPVCLLFAAALRTPGFGLKYTLNSFAPGDYRAIFHFAWYHLLMSISLTLLGYLDPIMLAVLDPNGFSSVAAYTIAVFVVQLVQIPYRAMTLSTFSLLTQAYEANDMTKVKDYYQRSGINILIAATLMVILIACNAVNVSGVLRNGYELVAPVILILLLGRYADMATGLNTELISISKYYKFNFYLSIWLVVVIVILNYLLIPEYGMFGAAWGSTIGLVLFNIAKLYFLWAKMRLQPFSGGSARILIAGACAAIPGYLLPFILNPFIDAIVRSTAIICVYTIMLVILKPSPDLIQFLAGIKKNKRLF